MTTHHHLFSIRLPNVQRWTTYLAFSTVAISGLLSSLLHDVLQWGWMLTERRLLTAHGIATAVSLVVVGGLLPLHIRLAWRIRRNLASGAVSLSVMALLGGTGLLLYYGGEEWRDWVRWAHIGVGIIATITIPVHIWLGHRRIARSAAPMGATALGSSTERVTA